MRRDILTAFDIPAAWNIDRHDGLLRLFDQTEDRVEGRADRRLEGEAEDGVQNDVSVVEGGFESGDGVYV